MKPNPFSAGFFFSLVLIMFVSGLYAQTSGPIIIPGDVKVDRNGKEPAIPFEQQFRLDTILVDNEYNIFPGPPCLDGNYYVGFQLYYDLGDLNTTVQWAMDLEISLLQGDTPLWTKPLHVEMENQTFIATVFHDQPLSCDGDYYVKIAQKDTTGAAPEQHLYLKAMLFKEFDAVFNPDDVLNLGYVFYNPLVQVDLSYTGDGAISYDIEWTYISKHDGFTGNTAVEAFDFKEPVRVTTAASYYKHPLFYPEGRVWFRARAVGHNPEYPDHRINGKWWYAESAITVSNQQPALNWQLQKSFAEEGKYKNLITYLDGSLRNRQSITNLSTEALSLVGESYYDYEGRKVLEMLPAPVSDNSLNYKSNLNNFTANEPLVQQNTSATKKKFHYDNANLENSTVANTSGAGNYYSSANQLPMVNKDYLPDAGGFVYTQTEFSRDNTGRVSNQSGVGELFRTDGFNSTRFYYGEAAPVELVRLFGSNVGNASHYKKNFVVDPNKQVSVTYLDQEGRTIATSLAGAVPNNLEGLASYDSLGPDLMTIDISTKNKKENGASKTAHKILNATPGTNYTFEYDLAALGADMESFGCQSCLFDLGITITNPRGKLLDLSGAAGNQSTNSFKYERKDIDAADCVTPETINDINFEIVFAEAGDYTIVKTLTPKELSFAEMKSILEQDATVQQQIQLIRDSYLIDSTQCDICLGCEEGEAIIEETIVEIANLDCDNILQQIINYYQDLNGNGYEVTQADIDAHELSCKYDFCTQNVESDVFEKQVARIENWTAAVSKGYDNLVDIDPFFNDDSLSGNGFKDDMEGKINNLFIANVPYYLPGDEVADGTNEFIGEIENVTDPANTDFYIKENGEKDAVNGKHLLYIDLMGRKSQMSTEEYNAELDKQRWYLYKGFYLEAKRKTKLMIDSVMNCDALRNELEINDNLPQEPDDIRAWGQANGVTDSISEEQLEMILANMSFNCEVDFDAADSTVIAGHLKRYFNSNPDNFFRLFLLKDFYAYHDDLMAVQDVLYNYGCDLYSFAVEDPLTCSSDTSIFLFYEDSVYYGATEGNSPPIQTNSTPGTNIMKSGSTEGDNLKMQVPFQKYPAELQEERRKHVELLMEAKWKELELKSIAEISDKQKQTLESLHKLHHEKKSSRNIIGNSISNLPTQEEYDALIDIYNATLGAGWRNQTGWQDAGTAVQDVSGWYGVATDINGHIISLDLGNNNLRGQLLPSIGNLVHLQLLDLSSNKITGQVPQETGSLVNLQYLYLGNNEFSGPIPSEIGNLSNLLYLRLNNNRFYHPIPGSFGGLVALELLDMSNARISDSIPSQLGGMINLQYLYLHNNASLIGKIPKQLGSLSNLRRLYLYNNNHSGVIPPELGDLNLLEELWLQHNNLSGSIPKELGQLSNLTSLSLGYSNFSGTAIPSELGNLTQLTYLYLPYCQLSDKIPPELGDLINLQYLNLNNNRLEHSIPSSFSNLASLEELYLSYNDLSGPLFPQIGSLLSLKYFILIANRVTGPLPLSLGDLTNLVEFDASNNEINEQIPPTIGNLTRLQILDLSQNMITGALPPEIGDLPAIQDINIANNNLNEPLPASLGNLTTLKNLYLANNKLRGPLPASLGNLINLQRLFLDQNELSGQVPIEVGNLSNTWRYLYLNRFVFSDLFDVVQNISGNIFYYSPQKPIDVIDTVVVSNGGSVTFIANVERGMSPSCKYQWFKSQPWGYDIPLTPEPTETGHTITIDNITKDDAGNYYYVIYHDDIPDLVLESHKRTIGVKGQLMNICLGYDQSNPTLANFHFELDWDLVVQQCMENLQEEAEILKEVAVNKYLEEEISKYYRKQSSQCLEKVSENLRYTYANKEYHYTLYYYDQAGNLVQTVPPKGVAPLSTEQLETFVAGAGPEPQHKLRTKYHYNSFNSLIAQHTPDSDSSYFWYDRKGQLRLSQNAQQHIDKKYSYTTYDRLGRITTVGEMTTQEALESLLTLLDSASFPKATDYALNDITRTHYDLPGLEIDFEQENLRSRVSWIEVMETPEDQAPVATYYSYDIHGNVKSILQSVPGMEAKRVDYVYDLVSGNVNYVMYQYGKPDQFLHRYKYDADNRIELVYSSTDAFIWNKDAEYFYYPHGPLARVELGQYNVQGLDYYYTLQGWLKGVNMPHEGDPGGDGIDGFRTGKDEFAFTLGYYQNDYTPIGSQIVTADARDQLWARYQEENPLRNPTTNDLPGLFNGNISWMVTDLPEIGRQQNSPAKSMQAMLYDYDQLNRITAAKSLTAYNPGSGFGQRINPIEAYDVDYSYDANGNLLTLQRMDEQGALMDDFTYSYYSNSNKLKQTSPVDEDKIYESGAVTSDNKVYRNIFLRGSAYVPSGSTVELKAFEKINMSPDFKVHSGANFKAKIWKEEDGIYQYDAIGNLIADLDEGVKIKWTPYGKVREVQKGDSTTIHYKYDGTGNRVEKSVFNGIDTLITRYIRDASGNVMAIYNDTLMTEQPIYGSSRLGMYRGGDSTGMRTLGYKNYELSNHLGNVLAVVTDNIYMNQDTTIARVVSTNDYYPFGLGMAGRSWNDSTYRYGFNGKEKDKNFGQTNYDYGFRIYNPQIAKFLSVDPLTSSYPMLTPYQFASNSPIAGIDLDGLEYLDYSEARVKIVSGTAFINLENFSNIYKSQFKRDNPNYGLIYKNSDGTGYGEGMLGNIIEPKTPQRKEARLSNKTNDPAYVPTTVTLKGTNRAARRQNARIGAPTISTGPGPSRGIASGTILLNAINFSLDLYVNTTLRNDQDELSRQVSDKRMLQINGLFDEEWITIEAPLNKALKDIQTAMQGPEPLIPVENQNIDDLSQITNIVLFGGTGNESEELQQIGNKIIDNVCNCRKENSNETTE